MSLQPSPTAPRQIVWPSVITVISAAILIGAEVFGAAFAGGWALAILFGLDDTGAHVLQAVLFALGVGNRASTLPVEVARRMYLKIALVKMGALVHRGVPSSTKKMFNWSRRSLRVFPLGSI